MSDNKFRRVLDVLQEHVSTQGSKKVWSYLDDNCDVSDCYTYEELDKSSTYLASILLGTHSIKRGDRVLLVFFPGLAFTASLIACFKAGIIAVPVFPPDPSKLAKDLHHFVSIQQSSGATIVLTHSLYDFAKKISGIKNIFSSKSDNSWPDLKWISVDDTLSKGKALKTSLPVLPLAPENNDIAFLQYTSGSTSEPKGVMISHGCLAHNLTLIITELVAIPSTICVSWLPQYHDMGLIGSYLGTLYCGGSGYYLSPISFLKDPTLWIQALSKYRGTHTQAPNFAYALVCRKFKDMLKTSKGAEKAKLLDLSSIKHMINAAEPVDYVAIADFYRTFQPYQIPANIVFPTYGLAEHTVFVCSGGKNVLKLSKSQLENNKVVSVLATSTLETTSNVMDAKDPDTQVIVGCGYPDRAENVTVHIVDENNNVIGNDKVGEIWVSSPSKALGYWNKPDVTKDDFCAKINSSSAALTGYLLLPSAALTGYLRTGDLGFLHEGELFICGRLKDLIIVRGSNHYPQDIERSAEVSHNSIRLGCSAAFAIKHEATHTETVVYVVEVKEGTKASEYDSIIDKCRVAVSSDHGVALSSICLLKDRSIPKTTSGKIARSWCKKAFIENKLSILKRWDGAEDVPPSVEVAEPMAVNEIPGSGKMHSSYKNISLDDNDEVLTPEDVKLITTDELVSKLEHTLVLVASSGPTPILQKLDPSNSLLSLGLDSLTIIQFKGLLENRFALVNVPDEFFFTQLCTLNSLAEAIKNAGLTAEQKKCLEDGVIQGEGGQSTIPITQSQPMCPWFTCCY
jgi:acyl-CoA synthetase (AMP-forming)/AMP-acid ligase II/acyl carrier protein